VRWLITTVPMKSDATSTFRSLGGIVPMPQAGECVKRYFTSRFDRYANEGKSMTQTHVVVVTQGGCEFGARPDDWHRRVGRVAAFS